MSTITENDEDLIPVETPIEEVADEGKEAPKEAAEAEDDEDDEDDARLAQSEDDTDDEVTGAHRRRRQQRRDSRKRARERTERELQMMREQNAELVRRLSAIETHTATTTEQAMHAQLQDALREVQAAEAIIAKATEVGAGDDVVAAMRIRDAAQEKARQLYGNVQQVQQVRQQPQVDERVVNHAQEWVKANPWYRADGSDAASATTKQIDAQLVREGFNPATRGYWEELTARVGEALAPESKTPASDGKRKGPPTGNTREHAPVSTRREIYVTPERKQAMVDAGIWDDPVRRQRMLKEYQAYDRGTAR